MSESTQLREHFEAQYARDEPTLETEGPKDSCWSSSCN